MNIDKKILGASERVYIPNDARDSRGTKITMELDEYKQVIKEVLEYVKPERDDALMDSGSYDYSQGRFQGHHQAIDKLEAKIKEIGL